MRKQILESLVRVFGCTEARELAHRPDLAAIHVRVNASRVRILRRKSELRFIVPAGEILGRVQRFRFLSRKRRVFEAGLLRLRSLGFPSSLRLEESERKLAVGFGGMSVRWRSVCLHRSIVFRDELARRFSSARKSYST